MQNKWKKILAVVLCLTMVFALVPAVSAESGLYGNETPADHQAPAAVEEEPEAMAWELSEADADPDDRLYDELDEEVQDAEPDKEQIDGIMLTPDDGEAVRQEKIGENSICLEEQPVIEKNAEANDVPNVNVYSGTMGLGWNQYDITAGSTTYRTFVPSESGTYRFFTLTTDDTYGYLQNSSKTQIDYNDDGGYGSNFMITYDMTAGTTYYVGARYYGDNTTGTIYVYAELYTESAYSVNMGLTSFSIETPGETLYKAFTPSVSGTYRIYSVDGSDTYLTVANSSGRVYGTDDDSGYSNNFQGDFSFTEGTTYYIGVKYYSTSATGVITVSVERQVIQSESLVLGFNAIGIETETTVYRTFTAPMEGWYWIYTAAQCSNGDPYLVDTVGTLAGADMKVYSIDDDGGYYRFHKFQIYMTLGETIYIGTRFYSSSNSGGIALLIEYPYVPENALHLNKNTVSVDVAGGIFYDTFTPTESGVYRVYTQGDYDTFGTLAILDTYGDNDRLKIILFDDDTASGGNFRYDYEMEAGKTYYIGYRLFDTSATAEFTLRILQRSKTFDGTIEWNSNDVQYRGTTPYVVYNGSPFTPRFTVKDKNGNVVDPGTYTYEYRENRNAGTGYVIVTFTSGYTGTAQKAFKIYLPPTASTTVDNVSTGVKIQWAAVTGAAGYVVYRRAWSTTTNGWTDFLRWNNTTATSYVDTNVYAGTRYQYGVKAYFAQRTDPVTGTLIGGNVGDNYNLGIVGPLKTTVRITTRKLTKLVSGSGRVAVSYDGSKVFTGYQIKYATNAAFTQNVKSVWVASPTTTTQTVKGLKNGTTYYFCVRSYHNFEGTKYFGEWSNALSVKAGSGQTVWPSTTKYRALLVGERDFIWYSGASVDTATRNVGDVNHMATMLNSIKGPKGGTYTITKKTNLNKSALRSAIQTAFSGTTDSDVSLFFIATHGDSDDEGQLVLTDGTHVVEELTFGELATMLSTYVKGDVIVILESCGAGSAIYQNGKQASEFDPELFAKQAVDAFAAMEQEEAANTGELRKSKYYVLAAARHHQMSWGHEGGDAGNYFTDWLIEGIGSSGSMPADTNNDNNVTLNELYNYIAKYNSYPFYSGGVTYYQQVQVYPTGSGYKLFKR